MLFKDNIFEFLMQMSREVESLKGHRRRQFQGVRPYQQQSERLTHGRSLCALLDEQAEGAEQGQLSQSKVRPSSSRTLSSLPSLSIRLEKITILTFLRLLQWSNSTNRPQHMTIAI